MGPKKKKRDRTFFSQIYENLTLRVGSRTEDGTLRREQLVSVFSTHVQLIGCRKGVGGSLDLGGIG